MDPRMYSLDEACAKLGPDVASFLDRARRVVGTVDTVAVYDSADEAIDHFYETLTDVQVPWEYVVPHGQVKMHLDPEITLTLSDGRLCVLEDTDRYLVTTHGSAAHPQPRCLEVGGRDLAAVDDPVYAEIAQELARHDVPDSAACVLYSDIHAWSQAMAYEAVDTYPFLRDCVDEYGARDYYVQYGEMYPYDSDNGRVFTTTGVADMRGIGL